MSAVQHLHTACDEPAVDPAAVAKPFARERLDAVRAISRRIFDHPELHRQPAAAALAYALRGAELDRLATAFCRLTEDVERVARGTTFHVAPANVPTMAVYSWLYSFVTGNVSVVRISREVEGAAVLCDVVVESLAARNLGSTTAFVTYEPSDEITRRLSASCDVRVLWGGDESIAALRPVPLGPRATDIVFGDRFSFAAIDAGAFNEARDDARTELVDRFVDDMYSFDQLACSSPRLLVWCGAGDAVATARRAFIALLGCRAGYRTPAAGAVAKELHAASLLITGAASSAVRVGPHLTLVEVEQLDDDVRAGGGYGLLHELRVEALEELVPMLGRRDQTLTYFGFSEATLRQVAAAVGGSGIDRIVPIGRALEFGRYWDGHDLLEVFTRAVHVVR